MNKVRMVIATGMILIIFISVIMFSINALTRNTNEYVEEESIVIEDILEESELVYDYSEFFTFQNLARELIISMYDERYDEIYDIVIMEEKNNYSKKEFINNLKSYYNKNFKYDYSEDATIVGYKNKDNLIELYKYMDDKYILKVKSLEDYTYIVVQVYNKNYYNIVYMEF